MLTRLCKPPPSSAQPPWSWVYWPCGYALALRLLYILLCDTCPLQEGLRESEAAVKDAAAKTRLAAAAKDSTAAGATAAAAFGTEGTQAAAVGVSFVSGWGPSVYLYCPRLLCF